MRRFKRWYRLQLYCLGRWLMHRYQKPLVNFDDDPVEIGLCLRELAKPRHLELCKVRGVDMEQLIEDQPT